jgi:hypothetical protein
MSWSKMGLPKNCGGMGIRDLHCFNQAMLAKQCSRLWKIEDRLIAQIMKAKYYPDCSVLDARTSGDKSFICLEKHTKLLSTLKNGLIWRVGNGNL